MEIMKNVDILDLVKINVLKGVPTKADPAPIRVQIEPVDSEYNVVFDEEALNVLNNKIAEFVIDKQMSIGDEKTFSYIEEFVARMVSELHRNGLVELQEVGDTPDDPYKDLRNKY
jgi:hypothetical protein